MEKEKESIPDPRFENFEEVQDANNRVVGFTLPNNQFVFRYDSEGGWQDEKGNYYNKNGVLKEQAGCSDRRDSQDSDEGEDQDIIDQLEQMLEDEERGIVHKKKTEQKEAKKEAPEEKVEDEKAEEEEVDYEKENEELVKKFKENDGIRQGLSKDIYLYFKIHNNQFQPVKLEIQAIKNVQDQNAKAKEIRDKLEEQRKSILEKQKDWLTGENFHLDYSGASPKSQTYQRYWYGLYKANPDNFVQIWKKIKKSETFKLLEHKTFYAFKSKFYLKKKMQEIIKELQERIKPLKDNEQVEIQLNNLPQDFPISFVLDLIDFSGAKIEDIIEVSIRDQFKAVITATKAAAILIANLEGYCHDRGEYIYLDVKPLKKQIVEKKGWFMVSLDSDYKAYAAELYDTMAFEQSKNGVVKQYEKENPFRWLVHGNILRRAAMFRGPTVDIDRVKQQCTEKDID